MTSGHRRHRSARFVAALVLGLVAGMQAGATEEPAREFIARINAELAELRLELITGSREMDASAIIDYFQPLMSWLETQNAGRSCGW